MLRQIRKNGIFPTSYPTWPLQLLGVFRPRHAGILRRERHGASVAERPVSQSPQEVTPCSATTVSTFQRAPHHSLQVKLENGHRAIFLRKFLRIIRAHGVFMAHRLLRTEPVPPTSTESGWSQQWAKVTCFTVGLWSSQNGEGLT